MGALTLHPDPELWGSPDANATGLCLSKQGRVRALAYGGKPQLKTERPQQFPGNRNEDRNERGRRGQGSQEGGEGSGGEGPWQRPRPRPM